MSTDHHVHDLLIGRQSIFDRNGTVCAYELLFRATRQNEARVESDTQATADVIVGTLTEVGVDRVLGGKRGFINIGLDFLLGDTLFLLPPENLVLEILETVPVTGATISRCRELQGRGYTLALDDYMGAEETWAPILEMVSIVKVDLSGVTEQALPSVVRRLLERKLSLLAEKVETSGQLSRTMEMGFDYFQGFFFARPLILSSLKVDPIRQALTGILSLILVDAETDEIVKAIRLHVDLVASLIKVANVVARSPFHTITDLRQAVLVMGRDQIRRWLELLLFSSGPTDHRYARPVFQMAVVRARLMELLSLAWKGPGRPDPEEAFLAGMFSLSESLLGIGISDLLDGLPVGEGFRQTLLSGSGPVGLLLSFAAGLERTDDGVERLMREIPVPSWKISQYQIEALLWSDDVVRIFSSSD